MKHSTCFTAVFAAVLGATFLLAGPKAPAPVPAETNLQNATVAVTKPVVEAPTHPKQTAIVPASALKLAIETSVKPAAAKSSPPVARPVSGETQTVSTQTPKAPAPPSSGSEIVFSRRDWVIEAVKKTHDAIVEVRVPRPNGAKDMIGTGVLVDQRGFIITNRHVVAGAKSINVILADQTRIAAELIVADARFDLAILRVYSSKQLPHLPLAPVDDLMVGEKVIAVGNPFGYSHSVSTGIISALGRDITMPSGDVLTGLIQTNASINPGNSGGPLLNVNGEFIGVNVALREGAQNIAFAINVGTVKNFLRQHLNSAKVSGIQHGLQCSEKTLGETGHRQQVLVSWFQGAGDLCKGDALVSIGSRKVYNTFDVERAFWGRKPGDVVSMKIVRNGQEMNVSLTVAASSGAGQSTVSLPRAVSQPVETPVAAIADPQR